MSSVPNVLSRVTDIKRLQAVAYVCIRQHTSAYVRLGHRHRPLVVLSNEQELYCTAEVSVLEAVLDYLLRAKACVMRQHTSAYVILLRAGVYILL